MKIDKRVIERLKNISENYTYFNLAAGNAEDIDLAISALEKQLNSGWIPVSERLPEFDSNCIVTTENSEVFTSKFYGYGEECQGFKEFPEGVWEINECGLDVIAWMPLPEAYKEVKIDL